MVIKIRGNKTQIMEKDGRTVGVELITPTEAVAYLNTMPGNRPLSNRQVEYLTEQALDIGKRRLGGDVLALDGYGNSKMLAGAVQNLWMYEHSLIPGHSRTFFTTKNAPGLTNHMMREFMTLHPGMVNSVEAMKVNPSVRLLGPPSVLAFCHYGIMRANPTQGAAFWLAIATQNFWGQDDPAFRLFDRLNRSKTKTDRSVRLAPAEVAALTIKAWNLWVQGKGAKHLRWKAPGHKYTGEEFRRIRSK
jgi:hypothetical protein